MRLTNKKHLAIFPARTILRDPRNHESTTCNEQDLNLHRTSVQPLMNELCSSENQNTREIKWINSPDNKNKIKRKGIVHETASRSFKIINFWKNNNQEQLEYLCLKFLKNSSLMIMAIETMPVTITVMNLSQRCQSSLCL